MMDQVARTELTIRDFFIRRLGQEYPVFLDVCKALPADRLNYRPHPASRSAGEMVALLAENCIRLCSTGQALFSGGAAFRVVLQPKPRARVTD